MVNSPAPLTDPQGRPVRRRRGRWVAFVHRYGWRAYALPILSAVTIAALVHGDPSGADPSHTATHVAGRPSQQGRTTTATGASAAIGTKAQAQLAQAEGLTKSDAGFGAGSTPAPVVINLGDDATSCAQNTYQQLVLVNIRKQHLWACEGHRQVRSTAVTTGATVDDDQTPTGSWRVQAKQRDRYLVGPGYRDYVKYWVPFNGDFGLHDASWQTMPFGSKHYHQHGSHGCVHLPTTTMAWLYHWARVGSTVVTVES